MAVKEDMYQFISNHLILIVLHQNWIYNLKKFVSIVCVNRIM